MHGHIYAHAVQWSEYVAHNMGGRNQADVAAVTGISQSTISRWLNNKGGVPSADSVVAFARALGGNPVEALVISGAILVSDLEDVVEVREASNEMTNAELVALLARRLNVPVTTGRSGQ